MGTERTAEQWLALDDLPTELARALTPGPWKHNWVHTGKNNFEEVKKDGVTFQAEKICHRCKTVFPMGDTSCYGDCSVPDRIKIDWNTAMEWYKKDGKLWTVQEAMDKIHRACTNSGDSVFWWDHESEPKHYLIAAAMAAGKKNNE